MQKIMILTDTGCDLDKETLTELGIKALPFTLTIGDITFRETFDKTTQEIYELMGKIDQIPKTAQITPQEFKDVYQEAYEQGYTDIISVSICSGGSGTYNNSILAKNDFYEENPEAESKMNIYNLDSKCYTTFYGYPITEAVKKINKGVSAKEICAYLQEWFDSAAVYAVPYNLKYAKKSGRISAAKAFAGEMLGLKPIIEFADGTTNTIEKVRGEKNIIPKLMEIVEKKMTPQTPYVIIHGRDNTLALELEKEMVKKYGRKPEMTNPIGAVVAANIGPDVVAILIRRKNIK